MSQTQTEQNKKIGKRFFRLTNLEIIFGDTEVILNSHNEGEFLIRTPYTAKGGNILPYMSDVMSESPAAVQIHPMNVLWTVPLNEFKQAEEVYTQATSGIITSGTPKIVI